MNHWRYLFFAVHISEGGSYWLNWFGSWGLVIELNFGSDFEHKVWSRFWSWSSGKIFELEFGQHFAAGNDICRVMKLNLGCDTLVSWTQPSGPLCLWQCFLNKSIFPFFRFSQFSFLSICPSSGWSTGRQSRQDYQLSQIFKRDFLEWILRTVLIGKKR